jgi:hypothetical protein
MPCCTVGCVIDGCAIDGCEVTTDGAAATVLGGAPVPLGLGRGAAVTGCRAALVVGFVVCDGAVFLATRSLGAGRSGFGAGRSAFFGEGSAAGGEVVLSIRAIVAGGVAGGTDAACPPLAPVAESGVAGVVADALLATVEAGALPFPICHHASAITSTAASAPAAMSSRRTMRTFAACCERLIACSTVALSDTDDGYPGPLSIERTPLRSLAMSSAL